MINNQFLKRKYAFVFNWSSKQLNLVPPRKRWRKICTAYSSSPLYHTIIIILITITIIQPILHQELDFSKPQCKFIIGSLATRRCKIYMIMCRRVYNIYIYIYIYIYMQLQVPSHPINTALCGQAFH